VQDEPAFDFEGVCKLAAGAAEAMWQDFKAVNLPRGSRQKRPEKTEREASPRPDPKQGNRTFCTSLTARLFTA
jgi:hypothetical protein